MTIFLDPTQTHFFVTIILLFPRWKMPLSDIDKHAIEVIYLEKKVECWENRQGVPFEGLEEVNSTRPDKKDWRDWEQRPPSWVWSAEDSFDGWETSDDQALRHLWSWEPWDL